MAKSRRSFTAEFEAQAVKLVTEQGKSVAEIARDLDLFESLLRGRERSLAEGGDHALPGKGNPCAQSEEVRRFAPRSSG